VSLLDWDHEHQQLPLPGWWLPAWFGPYALGTLESVSSGPPEMGTVEDEIDSPVLPQRNLRISKAKDFKRE
jgi:hypothetical protein